MERKEKWNAAFETYLHELDAKKPVVWGGDINVVRDDKGASQYLAASSAPCYLT